MRRLVIVLVGLLVVACIALAGILALGVVAQRYGLVPTTTATSQALAQSAPEPTQQPALPTALAPSATAAPQATATQAPTLAPATATARPTQVPTSTPAATATPLPATVTIEPTPAAAGLMTRSELGDAWPLTVEEGVVACLPGRLVVFTANGTIYAVNGTAKQTGQYAEIDPIWRDRPSIPGLKVSLQPILDRGLSLCR